MLPGSHGQPGDIIQDRVLRGHRAGSALQADQLLPGQDALHPVEGIGFLTVPEHGHLRLIVRIAQRQPDHEPVHLRIGKHLRSRRAHAVFRGDHQKRPLHGPGFPVHRHLPLLHRLQQRGLGFTGGAVDFIPQQQIRPDQGSGLINKVSAGPVVHGKARQIRGQDIRRKLNPPEGKPDGPAQSHRQRGFADARHIIQQDMPLRQQRRQDLPDCFLFSGDDLFRFPKHVFELFAH